MNLADIFTDVPDKILTQCGLVSALLVIAVIWLALQLAKTREAWESDRSDMMKIITSQNSSYDNLAVSHAKLEGMLLAVRSKR